MLAEDRLPGIEKDLWRAADKLRGSLHPGEYQAVVLGLVLLRYLSLHGAERGFEVPAAARWESLEEPSPASSAAAVATAVSALEQANPSLVGLLSHEWTDGRIDDRRLREVIELLGRFSFDSTEGDDLLGRVYEYFLQKFAEHDKKGSGQFYTPRCVVELLVDLLEPLSGRIYDPCCGTGGMFVRSLSFVEAHGAAQEAISIFGQELTASTWKLARMNLLLRGIEADLGASAADTFHADQHPGLEADYILANPPFNMSDWGAADLIGDPRWGFGDPPDANANFAWIQHVLDHLAPQGRAGIVLSNGSLNGGGKGAEAAIRAELVDAGLVECIVALPSKLFYSTQIPACLWIVAKGAGGGSSQGEVLFVDATRLGTLVTRAHRTLIAAERQRIADAFHGWKADPGSFAGEVGFSRAAPIEAIAQTGYNLSPPRYVGLKDEVAASDEQIAELGTELTEMIGEGRRLDAELLRTLADVAT